MLIYIDTNIYLGFYQDTVDRITAFDEMKAHATRIVITEQTIDEFMRNRTARLSALARNVGTSTAQFPATAIVMAQPEFIDIANAQERIKTLAETVKKRLLEWKDDPAQDLVFMSFQKIIENATNLRTTDSAFAAAQRRKAIGNPPTSPDKHTVGDELIWECLLEGCNDDLLVVSRDHTFTDNSALLRVEFEASGRRKLVAITGSLAAAFKLAGVNAAAVEQVAKAEEHMSYVPQAGFPPPISCIHCGKAEGFIGPVPKPSQFGGGWSVQWGCKSCGKFNDFGEPYDD